MLSTQIIHPAELSPEDEARWRRFASRHEAFGSPLLGPDFARAVDRVIAAGERHGKSLGRLVNDIDGAVALNRQGFDFICYSGDVWLLGEAIKAGVDGIRQGAGAQNTD